MNKLAKKGLGILGHPIDPLSEASNILQIILKWISNHDAYIIDKQIRSFVKYINKLEY